MPTKLVQYSFTAGEISPRLLMRGDIEVYPHGAQLLENFFVDYRGGAVSRPGTSFVGMARGRGRNVALQLTYTEGGGIILECTDQRFRFIQDGSYMVEAAQTISAVSGTVHTITSHGYAVDDWLIHEGSQYRVSAVPSANEFELEDMWGQSAVLAVNDQVARIIELSTPYAEDDLFELSFAYLGLDTVICHPDYDPRVLKFTPPDTWSIQLVQFSSAALDAPTNLRFDTNDSTPTGQYIFAVSAVLKDDTETISSTPEVFNGAYLSGSASSWNRVEWDPVPDAAYYIVWRSREFYSEVPSLGEDLGYAGKAYGTSFMDRNILPDFTRGPIIARNPFVGGAVEHVGVTNGGSGYTDGSAVTITGGSGSGFVGYIVTDSSGAIGAVRIVNQGSGYTEPVTVSVAGGGSGATFDVTLRSLDDTRPRCAVRYQQRLVFGGTNNRPSTIFGSRPGSNFDFTYSTPLKDDDSYEHAIDTKDIQYIKHLLPTNSGLMVFTEGGVFTVRGDATGRTITPLRVQVSPQMSIGASDLLPLVVDNDVLFAQSRGIAVRSLRYNPVSAAYSAEDLSILANHLISEYNIVDWAYAADPYRLIVSVREDGLLLYLTYMPSQKIFAWGRAKTAGDFTSVATVRENGIDRIYVLVRRDVNGQEVWFQEVFDERTWHAVHDTFCVDCGARREPTVVNDRIRVDEDGTVATAASLTTGDLIVVAGARLEVTGPSTVDVLVEPSTAWPIIADSYELFSGKVSSVSGLEHLEGETVKVIVDGNVHADKVVANGSISLDVSGWEVVAGLPFKARLQTLPFDVLKPVVQARRRRHWRASILVEGSRGLWVGTTWENLYEVKERELVQAGIAQSLFTGFRNLGVRGTWAQDSSICVEVRDPLPTTILGLAVDTSFGDEDAA